MPVNYTRPIEVRDKRNGGWFWVDKEVWSDKRLTASDKVVYGTLAYFSNNASQVSFPSIETVARFSDTSPRHVYRCLSKLEKLQYITIKHNTGKANHYLLIDNAIQALKQGGDNLSGVTNMHYGGDKKTLPTPDKYTPRTILNRTILNEQERKPNGFSSISYLKNIPLDDIQEFMKMTIATENQIRNKGLSLFDYCESRGKQYKNYKAFLRNALRLDYSKKSILDEKYVLSG